MRFVSGLERYVDQYRATRAAGGVGVTAAPNHRRMVALSAAFTPMIAFAALPVTAGLSVVATLVANVTARWVGVVVLVTAVVGLGYLTARWAARYDDVPAMRGLAPVAAAGGDGRGRPIVSGRDRVGGVIRRIR